MYKLTQLCLFLFPLLSFSQNANQLPVNASGKIEFTEVVNVDSTSAKALYSRARLFIADAFRNSKSVTQLEDQETTTIVVKGLFVENVKGLGSRGDGFVNFTMTIQAKDNRYRYSITDFEHHGLNASFDGGPLERDKPASGGMMFPKKFWEKLKDDCYQSTESMILQLKLKMLSTQATGNW